MVDNPPVQQVKKIGNFSGEGFFGDGLSSEKRHA